MATTERNALQESERRYKRLLASITDYIYSVDVLDGQAVKTEYGPGCLAVTGYSREEFSSDPWLWYRIIQPEDRPFVVDQVNRIKRGEPSPSLEHRIIHKDGRIRWISNRVVPHWDDQGKLTSYDGLIADITPRKEAELALQKSEERLALVIEGCNDGIWDWDLSTNRVYFSPRWKSMLGYQDCEVENTFSAWQALMHPEDRPRAASALEKYWNNQQEPYEFEHRLRHKDGSYRWILARGVGLRDNEGRPSRMAGSHVDLTGRKMAQEALARSEYRFRTLAGLAPVGIFEADSDGRCTYVNDRGCELTGLSSQECIGGLWTRVVHPDDQASVAAAALPHLYNRSHIPFECRLLRPDRRICWVVGRAVAFRDAQGDNRGFICTVAEITERKEAEQQLTRANAELAQSERTLQEALVQLKCSHEELAATQAQLIQAARFESVGTLAAGVAHEVKNPLQAILGGLDYLDAGLPTTHENTVMVLTDMREAVHRASRIISELFNVISPVDYDPQNQDLNEVVESSLRLMNSKIIAGHVNVARELAQDISPLLMDRGRIEQVFINVMINAVQAMPSGGTLTLITRSLLGEDGLSQHLRAGSRLQPGDKIVVAQVRDTGTGIDPKVLPRIFDPFFTTKPVGEGTGLGLFMARRIMSSHQGAILIENAPDHGAIVTIAFRANHAAPHEATPYTAPCSGTPLMAAPDPKQGALDQNNGGIL